MSRIKPYYALPLKLGKVIKKEKLANSNLKDSIRDHIHLMITTHFDENKHDEKFGNSIWENEFGNISKDSNIREEVKHSIKLCINRYESRLENVKVDIRWQQEQVGTETAARLSKRLDVQITGTIKVNRKPFKHNEQFYIAPLAYN
jgi:predicted component of type VI protein secretion system